METPVTPRETILDAARTAITGQRQRDYGNPTENFQRIADLWSTALGHQFTPADVGIALILLKVARLSHTPGHVDSLIDIAGYAACTAEAARRG